MAAGGEFVEGWLVAQVLGEGAFGEVRLLVHARSGARVALKAVRGGAGAGAREAALHRALRHAHVVRCLGARAHGDAHYLFLEHAAGGELFERIEPDGGMPPAAARRYWRQLAAGLRYLHARGVAHRDIKPENLLLDHRDRLKISDFGLATVFRHGARERLLTRVCGTLPYAAPEVLAAATRPYRAPPADLWAAAVVLVAMLLGELPWERACESDARFAAWSAWARGGPAPPQGAGGALWARAGPAACAWLRRALLPAPAARARLADLLLERWMCGDAPDEGAGAGAGGGGGGRCASQPARGGGRGAGAGAGEGEDARDLTPADMDALLSSSQPAHSRDLLLPDAPWTQAESGAARRLARVWVAGSAAAALRAVAAALRAARCSVRRVAARALAGECAPADLRLRAEVAGAARGAVLVQFTRCRGCGLLFQRKFLELRAALAPLAAPEPADFALPAPPAPRAAPPAPRPAEPMDEDHA